LLIERHPPVPGDLIEQFWNEKEEEASGSLLSRPFPTHQPASIKSYGFKRHPSSSLFWSTLEIHNLFCQSMHCKRGPGVKYHLTHKLTNMLSIDASPEAYLSLRKMKSVFVILEVTCDKYASGEA
jgi:hypothetical protein